MQLYLITRTDNERYIGITSRGLDRRAWEHKNGYGSSYLKGEEFTIKELLSGPEKLISALEGHFIISYNCSLNKIVGGLNGRGLQGSQNGVSKLLETDIPKIIELYNSGKTQKQIADIYGVSRSNIGEITRGNSWRHVNTDTVVSKRNLVDIETRNKIKLLYSQGLSNTEISKSLSIKYNTVYSYTKDLPLNNEKTRNTRRLSSEIVAKILDLSNQGISVPTIAKQLAIGETTARRYIAKGAL